MRKLMPIILIAIAVIAIHLYKKNQNSYFDANPVKPLELNFRDPTSEPLYKKCVVDNNNQMKRFIDNGRLPRDKYKKFLKIMKKTCKCYAGDTSLLNAQSSYNLNPRQGQRKKIAAMNNTLKRCMEPPKKIKFEN